MQPTKIKLALMSSQQGWGGGEQFLWSLGSGLIERGHSVLWVCDKSSPLHDRVVQQNFDCCPLPGRAPNPKALLTLRKACSSRGIQVLHANDSHALTWSSVAMLGKLRVKRVGVKHTAFPLRSALRYNWMLDALVCVSHAVQNICTDSGVAPQKTQVIYGGVEPPKLERWQERMNACETLGIHNETTLYAAVGSLIPCKGYDRLIEAAHHLRWHMNDFCIVICGEGKSRPELELLIRKYSLQKHVRLLGFQERPEKWICAADAFVHPSLSEGLSLVTIQSQMLGVPAVASDVGGLHEVLHFPGSKAPLGWIIPGNDPSALAELMKEAVQNTPERLRMIRSAKDSAMERFHLRRMIDQFEQFYENLLLPTEKRATPIPSARKDYKQAG